MTSRYAKEPRWRTRQFAGVTLTKIHPEDGEGWYGQIGGETWYFYKKADRKWQGYTKDHLTGTARSFSLRRCVAWVSEHQDEWQAKLTTRRAKGTRLVDPAAPAA